MVHFTYVFIIRFNNKLGSTATYTEWHRHIFNSARHICYLCNSMVQKIMKYFIITLLVLFAFAFCSACLILYDVFMNIGV